MLRAYIIQLKCFASCLYHVVLNIHFLDFNEFCWLKITCSIHLILRTNYFSNNEPFFFLIAAVEFYIFCIVFLFIDQPLQHQSIKYKLCSIASFNVSSYK